MDRHEPGMYMEQILEMRGMHRSDIVDYFVSLGGMETEPSKYGWQNWTVEIGEERTAALGALMIPSTIVKFKGEKGYLEQAIADFRLKFLAAGG